MKGGSILANFRLHKMKQNENRRAQLALEKKRHESHAEENRAYFEQR